MYPWKSVIEVQKQSACPVYLQIVNAIIKEIVQGRLHPGQRLVGTRGMADLLGINRKTVVVAYDELMAQSWIEILPSKGTFVSNDLPLMKYQRLGVSSPTQRELKQTPYELETNSYIRSYQTPPSHILEINDGSPDDRLAPIDTLLKNYRSIARSRFGRKLLSYSDVKGDLGLRKTLAQYLRETRGLNGTAENILITRGTQMAIFLLFKALLRPGDKVIVGRPNYNSADAVIRNNGAELMQVSVDEDGIVVEEIEAICQKHIIRAIYITPHHHFPTTVTLSAARRLQLLDLAQKYKIAILEDDYDYDFNYENSPILPLVSSDTDGLLIYMGSFSKQLAPTVRVGYLFGPENLITEVSKLRRIVDRQGDPLLERAVSVMIEEGEIRRHLHKTVKEYRKRRDYFCQLLQEILGSYIQFKVPEGGMAVWVRFNSDFDLEKFLDQLLKKGLYFNIDYNFVYEFNAARFGFASLNRKEIRQCFEIISTVLAENK